MVKSADAYLTVLKIATVLTIEIDKTEIVAGQKIQISGFLRDDAGAGIPLRTIHYMMSKNGGPLVEIGTSLTDFIILGWYAATFTIDEVGAYTFYTEFLGDDYYEGCPHNGKVSKR